MNKNIFDILVNCHKQESVEELTMNIIALQNIECSDRAFANHCEAGFTIFTLNTFFDKLKEFASSNDSEKLLKFIKEELENAENSYDSIRRSIREINNPSRVETELTKVKSEVEKFLVKE